MPTTVNLSSPVTNSGLNTGLTAWWRAVPNGTYTTAVTDFIGSVTMTVANGASLALSGFNSSKVFVFDGADDAAGSPGDSATWDLTAATGNFTIGSWVYLGDTSFSTFITQNTGDGLGWWLYYSSGFIILGFSRTSGGAYAGWSWTPSTATWYGITVTKNDSNYECFVNGVSLGVFTDSTAWANRSGQLVIGALNSAGIYELSGRMDNIRLYSRALSTTEVKALYGEDLLNDLTLLNWQGEGARAGGTATVSVEKMTSGGARAGGTASPVKLTILADSSGALAGGTGVPRQTITLAGSSGAILAGVGASQALYSVTAESGGQCGQSAGVQCVTNLGTSGGAILAGVAIVETIADLTATGGLVANGSGIPSVLIAIEPSGGAALGGAAIWSEVEPGLIASGGVLVTGSAVVQQLYSVTGSGGLVAGGQVRVTSVTNFGTSGGLSAGGSAMLDTATLVTGLVAGGVSPVSVVRVLDTSGGVRITPITALEVSWLMIDEDFRTFLIDRLGDLWEQPGKIQEGHNEQSTEYPRIWYQRRSSSEQLFFNGPTGLVTTNFDVEAISDDLNEAQQLARGIKSAINGYRGDVGESIAQLVDYADHSDEYIPSGIGDDEGAHVASIDVRVIHKT